jgi:hypothetical protein
VISVVPQRAQPAGKKNSRRKNKESAGFIPPIRGKTWISLGFREKFFKKPRRFQINGVLSFLQKSFNMKEL